MLGFDPACPWDFRTAYQKLILLFVFISLLSGKLSYGVVGASIISLLLITGVLDTTEALSGFANTNVAIMLCMMVLSAALMQTSLVERIVGLVRNVGHSERALVAGFGLIAAAMAQFMNAFVAVACLLPLITGMCQQLNMNPVGIMSLVNIGCTASYLTPMANPGIPLAMAAGGYSLKDCLKMGILPGLLICAVGVVWCSLFFPAY